MKFGKKNQIFEMFGLIGAGKKFGQETGRLVKENREIISRFQVTIWRKIFHGIVLHKN